MIFVDILESVYIGFLLAFRVFEFYFAGMSLYLNNVGSDVCKRVFFVICVVCESFGFVFGSGMSLSEDESLLINVPCKINVWNPCDCQRWYLLAGDSGRDWIDN